MIKHSSKDEIQERAKEIKMFVNTAVFNDTKTVYTDNIAAYRAAFFRYVARFNETRIDEVIFSIRVSDNDEKDEYVITRTS